MDIAAHYFSDYYGRLDLGTRGMVSLVGRDGVVRARQSGSDQTLGQDVSGSTLLLLAGERTDGTFYSPYRIDAVPRYVGFRALSDYPLLVLVARAQDDALAAVNARKATYLLVASGISLLILGFCAALARGVFKDHRALRQSEIARAERERTLDKLRNAELRTRQLIESLPEAIIMTSQGVIQYVNGATVQLFGVASAADMTGRRITDFTDSKDAALVAEKTLAFNQAPLRIPIWELRMLKTDGTAFDAEIASISFLDNEAFTVQHIIRDITPRKQSEIEIQVAQELLELRVSERTAQLEAANCELETFSYAVSHDLHAPLRAVGGFAQILEEHLNGRLDDEGRRLLGRIRTGAQRMGSLIDSLLQFSRTGRGALVVLEVDLEEIFASVVADIQLAYPDSLVRIGALPRIRGDATLLREVVANLLDNAFKYSSKAAHPKIDIGQMSLEQGSAIFVRDNGAGFDSGNAEQLFTPFRRLHSESEFPGSGIGLALCKRIIDRHGGRIWAESTPGQGASFFFTLDADSPPTAADGPLSG